MLDGVIGLTPCVLAVAVTIYWSRYRSVLAAAEFLGIDRRVARKIPLETARFERWIREHAIIVSGNDDHHDADHQPS